MQAICDDLEAETADLVTVLTGSSEKDWDRTTPSPGWSIRDQVSHLSFFDMTGRLAATDPDAFAANAKELMKSGSAGSDAGLPEGRLVSPHEVLDGFTKGRASMIEAFRNLDPKARLPWYGPAMGALSFATARLMETWAHGQDVCDTVGAVREPSARLRHVAHIGVRARPFAYLINGKTVPSQDVTVRLTAPNGDIWAWNETDETISSVEGSALDFCLLVTQRRNIADTSLVVTGEAALDWMPIAQAFAGAPGAGRPAQRPEQSL